MKADRSKADHAAALGTGEDVASGGRLASTPVPAASERLRGARTRYEIFAAIEDVLTSLVGVERFTILRQTRSGVHTVWWSGARSGETDAPADPACESRAWTNTSCTVHHR